MDVRLSGIGLDGEQKDVLDKFIGKLERAADLTLLHANIKEHRKAGGRSSYTIQLRGELMKGGKKTMEKTAEGTDWDFEAATKAAFSKLEKEVRSKEGGWLSRLIRSRKEAPKQQAPE